jgi:hypothetical protein
MFELGTCVAYYLGQHPEICKELTANVGLPGMGSGTDRAD